eukprot:sb/3474707/
MHRLGKVAYVIQRIKVSRKSPLTLTSSVFRRKVVSPVNYTQLCSIKALSSHLSACQSCSRGERVVESARSYDAQGTLQPAPKMPHNAAFSERAVVSPARLFTRVLWSAAIEMLTIASRALYNTLSPYILYERVC